MRDELRNDLLGDQCARLALSRGLKSFLDGDNRLDATAVHELHDQVDHAFIVKNTVVLHLQERVVTVWICQKFKTLDLRTMEGSH